MAKLKVSPLYRVIDARRWAAEAFLGRLIIVVHAAFLDVGFMPYGGKSPNPGGLAEQVGRTASTLSLRYAAPQLANREDAAVLALCVAQASERHIVFYAHIDDTATAGGNARRAVYWKYVDVVALVPLLSGFLDDMERALRSDALGTRLWRALTDGFCRRLLSDLCSNNGVPLEPTFTSLPADIKLAILEKLTDGEDLARMECTSKEMRCLVGEHDGELWKAKYVALCARRWRPFRIASVGLPEAGSSTGMISWKDRYVEARARQLSQCRLWIRPQFLPWNIDDDLEVHTTPTSTWYYWRPMRQPIHTFDGFMIKREDFCWYDHEFKMKLEDSRPDFLPYGLAEQDRVVAGGKKSTHGRPRVVWKDDRKRHGRAGAIHSPSSRYRWNHR